MFVCKKGLEVISKIAVKSDKIEKKAIGIFILFALTLFLLNQGAYMFFKDKNLYEVIGVSRRMSISELKEWGVKRRVELYQIGSEPAPVE
jgi:hypothetical protein